MLRDDLLDAAAGYPACMAAVRAAFGFMDSDAGAFALMRAAAGTCIPFLIDPMRACRAPRDVGLVHCSLVAGYILAVAAYSNMCAWPTRRLRALRLPYHSRLRRWLLPALEDAADYDTRITGGTPPVSDSGSEAWWNPDVLDPRAPPYTRACFGAAREGAEADAPG